MYYLKLVLLLFVTATLINVNGVFAQDINRTNNWIFGVENSLHFSSTGGVTSNSNSSITASEATASISDKNGDLLFYTDGMYVWNRNHQVMENGTSLNGRKSSSQPVLIVPNPVNENLYYIFTIGSYYGELFEGPFGDPAVDHGLNYSVVDFSENADGKITDKNVHLLDHTALKMSAIEKCSDNSYWLTTLSTTDGTKGGIYNTFYSFKVGTAGVDANPVSSTTDLIVEDSRGGMKFSPDGTLLATANVTNRLLLSGFDVQSGTVTTTKLLSIKDFQTHAVAKWPYSVEFSLDSKILYTSSISDEDSEGKTVSGLVQFVVDDFETNSFFDKTILADNENIFGSVLQLARDEKIYRAYSLYDETKILYLGAINNPTLHGLDSGYQHNAKELPVPYYGWRRSLPHFVPSFFHIENLAENLSDSKEILICEELDFTFTAEDIDGAEYFWFKDGIELVGENQYFLTITNADRGDVGHYELIINPNDGTCSRHKEAFVVKVVPLTKVPEDLELSQCKSKADDDVRFNLYEFLNKFINSPEDIFYFYTSDPELNPDSIPLSREDAESFNFDESDNGILYIEAINKIGCSSFQRFNLKVVDSSLPNLSDVDLCDVTDGIPGDNLALYQSEVVAAQIKLNEGFGNNISFSFFASYNDALLENNEIIERIISNNTVFWVRGEKTGNDCLGITQITLNVIQTAVIELDSSNNVICIDPLTEEVLNPIVLGSNLGADYNYKWIKDGTTQISENPTIEVTEIGRYKVEITSTVTGCSYFSNEVEITLASIPVNHETWLSVEQSEPFSSTNNVRITAYGLGDSVFSYRLDNGSINYDGIFNNLSAGAHIITITNAQGCFSPLQVPIYIIGFPKFFTPNNDGYNDWWNIYDSDEAFELESIDIRIYDRYGKLVTTINSSERGWDGTYNGQMLRSDDYWFEIIMPDNHIYRNHFSLVR